MKKIIFYLTLILSLHTMCGAGYADNRYSSFESVPEDWTVSLSDSDTNAGVTAENGVLKLSYDTTDAIGKAEVVTGENVYDKKLIYADMSFSYSGADEKSVRSLSIAGGNEFYTDYLFEIKGNRMTFFGTDEGCSTSEGEKINVSLAINMSDMNDIYAVASVNGEEKFSGTIQLHQYTDLSKVKFRISNTSSGKLTQNGVMNIYSFNTSASDSLPVIKISDGQRTKYKEGEEIKVTAEVTEGDFDSIVFFVDGTQAGSAKGTPAEFAMESKAGKYSVYAEARIGSMSVASEAVTITVEENDAPSVSFKDYSGSITVEYGELEGLEVLAEDSDSIAAVKIYINGILSGELKTAPYIFNTEELAVGNNAIIAEAFDKYGKSASCTLNVKTVKYFESLFLHESKFEDYASDTTFSSGIVMYQNSGYVKADKIDDEHGLSLLIGIDEADTSVTSDTPYSAISVSSLKNFVFECDFYIGSKETSGSKKFSFRTSKGHMDFVRFKDKMEIGLTSEVKLDYDEGHWYNFKMEADVINHVLTLYLDGEEVYSSNFDSTLTSLGTLRIYAPLKDTVKTYIAVDNIWIKQRTQVPEIICIEDGNEIPSDSKTITAYLSTALYSNSVSKETVSITDETGTAVELSEVKWNVSDNSISVTPKATLKSDMKYLFIISEKAKLDTETETGAKISAAFKTVKDGAGISACNFYNLSGTLRAGIQVYNTEADAVSGYAVMTVWKDGKYIGKDIERITIPAGETSETTLTGELPDGGTAEVYFYSSLSKPVMMANRIYTYTDN